jgi:hypothetical protein
VVTTDLRRNQWGLALFFGHVVAVGLVGPRDRVIPAVAADLVISGHGDRVADVVVIADRIYGLGLRADAIDAFAHAQQFRVEQLLLSLGVHLEKCGQPRPHSAQRRGVGVVDLFEPRKQPPLLMVVIKDQLGDVHSPPVGGLVRWRPDDPVDLVHWPVH